MDYNLYGQFQPLFERYATKELLSTETGQVFLYRDIDALSARYARFLSSIGTMPGNRISVQVEKSPQCLALYLACLRAGFVFHPLNMGYKKSELEYFLQNAEPAVVVCDPAREDEMRSIVESSNASHLFTMSSDGNGSLDSDSKETPPRFDTVPRAKDELAALLYSSGTTGVPKGIMLSHSNLLRNTEALVQAWRFSSDDRLLHALPIFHVHGLFVAIGCVLLSGASMRWLSAYNAKKAIEFLPECTVMMGVPTYYTRLLAEASFTADAARKVRVFISGSAPLLRETFLEFESRTGHRILERYGMTETNMNTSNPLADERKPGTVGPALPGVEVRITDDDDQILPPGEIGNIQVRGPNVFVGYWKLAEKTAEDFTDDRYFRTGDNGFVDEDGYVSIVGRAKDMVISGGLNVYPKEIELFIDDLPGVRESAVIGVPHADFGEAVVAVVVPERKGGISANAVIAACKAELANFKVPKRVVFVDQLPRNTMAKVQKNVLRESWQDLIGE
jgi:malonyl-CoA/methylmalonyl-CoA synthetase